MTSSLPYSLKMKATLNALPKSRTFIRQTLKSLSLEQREMDIQLALGEVMQNIIRYGFEGGNEAGEVTIFMGMVDGELECHFEDNGNPSNPETWLGNAAKRRPTEGGYGLSIIEAIARLYEVEPLENGNRSRLVFSASKDA